MADQVKTTRSDRPRYAQDERRVVNPHPWRHYRRSYAPGEVIAGIVVIVGLVAVAVWVRWMGVHPDPALARVSLEALAGDATRTIVDSAPKDTGRAAASAPTATAARGVLPVQLAPPGYGEGKPAVFDADNLYEKIDGRANYFTSRGFQSLAFVSLTGTGGAAAGASVDVELYDMGSAENALSAYGGEKAAESVSERHPAGLWHIDRNALYLTQGRYYLRAIGSDETDAIRGALLAIKERVQAAFPGEVQELPWAHRLFDAIGVSSSRIEFHREAAFSFGFANDVYAALLDDEATELYVTVAPDAAAAAKLVGQFLDGFASYGERVNDAGEPWVRDRYLSSYATARADRTFVFGVRGAPSLEAARAAIAKLAGAVRAFPEVSRPVASTAPTGSPGSPAPIDDHYAAGGEGEG